MPTDIFSPPVGSGRAADVAPRPRWVVGARAFGIKIDWGYVDFPSDYVAWASYVLEARRPEPDPATSLAMLVAMLPASGVADYLDSPEESARRSRVTEALFSAQAESLAQYDD